MGNQETRGMHFVPVTYLNKFGSLDKKMDCLVFFFDKLKGNKISATSPSNLCKKRDIYRMHGGTVEERQCVEDFYQAIEDRYDYIYKLLTDDSIGKLSQDDHELVLLFVITLLFRNKKLTSDYSKFIEASFEKAQSVAKQYGQDYFYYGEEKISFQNKTIKEVLDEVSKKYRSRRVSISLLTALRLFDLRKDDAIHVLKVPNINSSFLTSDNPISTFSNEKSFEAPFNIDSCLTLVIDDVHQLIIYPKTSVQTSYSFLKSTLEERDVIMNNIDQYFNAERFIISKGKKTIEDLLDLVKDYKSVESFILRKN